MRNLTTKLEDGDGTLAVSGEKMKDLLYGSHRKYLSKIGSDFEFGNGFIKIKPTKITKRKCPKSSARYSL
jgi:hypothetical protein